MKDLKYLLLLISFVTLAHIIKNTTKPDNEARTLPDTPDNRKQKDTDSGRIESSYKQLATPAVYNLYKY